MSWRTPMHNKKTGKSHSAHLIAKITLFSSVMLFSMHANAEYYFVYQNSCCNEREKFYHATPHTYKKTKWVRHKTNHHKKYARKSTRHDAYSYKTSCCKKQYYHPQHHAMKESREYYIDRANYSHDLSTGDDNTFFYPGMNIDQ